MKPALVVAAHSLDLVTFLAAVTLYGSVMGEANPYVRTAYQLGGPWLVIAWKAAQAAALAFFVAWMAQHAPRWPWMNRWAVVPAVLAGLAGALVNTLAVT